MRRTTCLGFWLKRNKLKKWFSQNLKVFNLLFTTFFRVETIDGSAVEGEDYEPLNEILTFEPNEREKEVTLGYVH